LTIHFATISDNRAGFVVVVVVVVVVVGLVAIGLRGEVEEDDEYVQLSSNA